MKNKPASARVFAWLKENLGKSALAPLTTTDASALLAAVQLVELMGYGYPSRPALCAAFAAIVGEMQRKCQYMAFHSIAMLLDWPDRAKIWAACNLEPLANVPACKYE